ncbi:MAG TPA: MFS transporter, partial [Ktedonobacterales bacterium]|nr:MFS transporter [Ktedonobacterales bacterium]
QSISVVGDIVFNTTLVLWVASVIARGQAWAPLAVSGLLLAAAIPVCILGPIAGVFADRWDKRRTMLRADALRAALVALLILATGILPLPFFAGGTPPLPWQLGLIYGVVALASVCSQFFNPSELALIGSIVEAPYLARASGLTRLTQSIAAIAGPPLAALLVFAGSAQLALLLDALSFVVSFVAMLALRAPISSRATEPEQRAGLVHELAEGIRFYAGNRVLVTLLVTGVPVLLGAGTLNTLDIFFLTQNLHAPASLYGIFSSVMGAGLIVGSLLAALLAQRVGVARSFSGALVAMGAVVFVLARMTQFAPGLAFMGALGIMTGVANVTIVPLMFAATPQALIGRVYAVFNPVTSVASMLSIALAGYLDGVVLRGFHATALGIMFGPVDLIYTGTGILIVLGGFYAAANLRDAGTQANA